MAFVEQMPWIVAYCMAPALGGIFQDNSNPPRDSFAFVPLVGSDMVIAESGPNTTVVSALASIR